MFIQRLITGLCLFVFVLFVIIFLPFTVFFYLTSIAFLFAAWEWGTFFQQRNIWLRVTYLLLMALGMFVIRYLQISVVLWVSTAWWIFAFFLIISYPKGISFWNHCTWIKVLMGFFVILPSWLAIITIRSAENGVSVLLSLLFLVWSADVGAYFVGKWRGKHYLLPKVSPKKTWEGLLGGIIFGLLITLLGLEILSISFHVWFSFLLLSFITILFSVVGDLFESMLKREANIKDIAHYLPGHGGFLDRIDSLTAAAPIFLLGCLLLGLH